MVIIFVTLSLNVTLFYFENYLVANRTLIFVISHFIFLAAKIGIFYIIFYSCLAAFFAVLLVGFFQTLDVKQPTQQNLYSLIKANPGMHCLVGNCCCQLLIIIIKQK